MKLLRKNTKADNNSISKKRIIALGSGVMVPAIITSYVTNNPLSIENNENLERNLAEFSKDKINTRVIHIPSKKPQGMYSGGNYIVVEGGNNCSSSILAHEIGHAMNHKNVEGTTKLGRVAHKIRRKIPRMLKNDVSNTLISGGSGALSGVLKAKREQNGQKESTVNKIIPYAVPTLLDASTNISEIAASRQGLKLLKKAGASKKAMRAARINMIGATGTYLAGTGLKIASTRLSKELAYKAARKKLEKNSRRDNEVSLE